MLGEKLIFVRTFARAIPLLKNAVPREGGGQARYELKPADYFSVDFSSGDE